MMKRYFPPSELTEEELVLQSKYATLKKMKESLQDSKTTKPNSNPVLQVPKILVEAKRARETAEKLAKAGKICTQQTTTGQEQGFKKPLRLEKKLGSTEKSSVSYQPFSASKKWHKDKAASEPKEVKNLHDSSVSTGTPDDKASTESSLTFKLNSKPIQSSIFIYGHKLSKELLEEHFSKFGKILKIKIETDEKAFIAFKTAESAEHAIREMHLFDYDSFHYFQVSLARYQPRFDNSRIWSNLTANKRTQNLKEKENREARVYDDNPFE